MIKTIHLLSDTHNQHDSYDLPGGDILIHAGDCTGSGTLSQAINFLDWYANQDYSYLILIAGNHDWCFEKQPELMAEECAKRNITLLNDSSVEIEGIKVHGSAITPWFYSWAFNRYRGADIQKHWDLIPKDTEILVTHGPPHDILDKTTRGDLTGCANLLKTIKNTNIKLHVFGHIHEARGHEEKDGILYVNASSLDERYQYIEGVPYKIVRDKKGNYSVEK